MVVLLSCLALAQASIIPDQRLFVTQAVVRRPLLACCSMSLCPGHNGPFHTWLQATPRESFDYWLNSFKKVYEGVQVRALRVGRSPSDVAGFQVLNKPDPLVSCAGVRA